MQSVQSARRARRGRSADPYRDLEVIDARAPRFNQAFVGVAALVAVASGWWVIVALLALQFIVGLGFGRRFCLACVFYFEVVQPILGEGPVEDSRPPRFANQVGALFLSASSAFHLLGATALGNALALIVAALALLAAVTGFCVGCEIYRLVARARGIRPGNVACVDPSDFGRGSGDEFVVQFTHPLCSDCHAVESRLRREHRELVSVDVSKNPEVARRYRIALVPTAFRVAPGGRVAERLA